MPTPEDFKNDQSKYLKKPLSVNTRRRIANGLHRSGSPLAHLYIHLINLQPEHKPAPASDPP